VIDAITEARGSAERIFEKARAALRLQAAEGDLDTHQHAAHGVAWLATYVETLKALAAFTSDLSSKGKLGEMEQLLIKIAAGEYLNQIAGGIPMNQTEFFRVGCLGLAQADLAPIMSCALFKTGNTPENRARLVDLMQQNDGDITFGDCGLDDTLTEMRSTMQRFVAAKVAPHAHKWHLENAYVPMEIIQELAALGVFALTLPEEHGGLGLPKEAMCVVSEELSRGWIAVGSLGTRAEIACELILCGGTVEQKSKWLPKIASGEILPTAVFTEPNTGSDLGALRTRAEISGDIYKITGNKTWITHPVRADLMTLLARTDPDEKGYKGLSMTIPFPPPA
jgi:(2S)-methylsuccinyl-CoA dehydrogenase